MFTAILLLLAIIEGLTEFIPVSSAGHLVLFGKALYFSGRDAAVYALFIQIIQTGAILAALVFYFKYFLVLLVPSKQTEETAGYAGVQGWIKLVLSMLPALCLGLCCHSYIGSLFHLLHLPIPILIAVALIISGILLILVEKFPRPTKVTDVQKVTYLQSFLVGCFQCLFFWPGMSRAASTIIGARFLGFERSVAAHFSFIIGVPITIAAGGYYLLKYDLLRNLSELRVDDIPVFTVGFIVSFLVGLFAIKFFLKLLRKYTLAPFGWYNIILGLLVILFCVIFPGLIEIVLLWLWMVWSHVTS